MVAVNITTVWYKWLFIYDVSALGGVGVGHKLIFTDMGAEVSFLAIKLTKNKHKIQQFLPIKMIKD